MSNSRDGRQGDEPIRGRGGEGTAVLLAACSSARKGVANAIPPVDRGLLLLAAWAAIGIGAATANGHYTPFAIGLVAVGVALLLVSVISRPAPTRPWTLRAGLAIALTAAVIGATHYASGIYGAGRFLDVSRTAVTIGVLIAVAWIATGAPRAGLGYVVVFLSFALAAVTMVISSPHPFIDVWVIFQEASRGLAHGWNVYSQRWTGIGAFPPDIRAGALTHGFVYLPGTILALAPFYFVLGDVRYGLILAMVVAAILVGRIGGKQTGALLATLLLFFPRSTFGIEQSWNEPLILVALVATVYAVRRKRLGWAVAFFAAALTFKQHVVLLVPLAAVWRDFGWRRTLLAVAIAIEVTLPWVLADLRDFLHGTVAISLHAVPRVDSLSLFTTASRAGLHLHFALVVTVTAGALAVVMWRLPKDSAGFALGSAVVLSVFDLVNKQTFFNQWSLVLGLIILAVSLDVDTGTTMIQRSGWEDGRARPDPRSPATSGQGWGDELGRQHDQRGGDPDDAAGNAEPPRRRQ